MTHDELITALEAAAGPSRELDDEIVRALGWTEVPMAYGSCWASPDGKRHTWLEIPRYTASLDAALTLVPAGAHWVLYSDGVAYVGPDQEPVAERQHDAPALTLCIAALKARQAVPA